MKHWILVVFIVCSVAALADDPILVPPEVRGAVPKGFVLRAVLHTNLSSSGETLFLYDDDNDEDAWSETHLHAIRNGSNLPIFDGHTSHEPGLQLIRSGARQFVGFAYHEGADGADTRFVIYAFLGGLYKPIFEQQTTEGQVKLLSESPLSFEIWSADWELDHAGSWERGESCVWCPHRYRVRTLVMRGDSFVVTGKRITRAFLDPDELASKPFAVLRRK